ncbi:MAG: hypothetical protein D6830_02025 [Ignavibacteria bacterium]|nr:MAG: hypothetical protein D6830_02025 [Ignavibacteria bacterium]
MMIVHHILALIAKNPRFVTMRMRIERKDMITLNIVALGKFNSSFIIDFYFSYSLCKNNPLCKLKLCKNSF